MDPRSLVVVLTEFTVAQRQLLLTLEVLKNDNKWLSHTLYNIRYWIRLLAYFRMIHEPDLVCHQDICNSMSFITDCYWFNVDGDCWCWGNGCHVLTRPYPWREEPSYTEGICQVRWDYFTIFQPRLVGYDTTSRWVDKETCDSKKHLYRCTVEVFRGVRSRNHLYVKSNYGPLIYVDLFKSAKLPIRHWTWRI